MAEKEAVAAGDQAEQQRQATVKRWLKRIESAQSGQKDRHAKFSTWRKYITGELPGTEKGDRGANIIFANHATILPYIYARNPEIQVVPAESVGAERYAAVKNFARTLTVILNRCMVKDAKLKRRAKSAIRSIQATGEGWLKMAYLREWDEDPTMKSRLSNAQDNLKRIEYLLNKITDPAERDQTEAERAELEQQIAALSQQVEVIKSEGLVIDVVAPEDMLILDQSCKEFGAYVEARAIAQGMWWTKEEYEELFGWPEDGKPAPKLRNKPSNDDKQSKADQGEQWVRGWEVWDRISNTVYTFAEGMTDYCREPFQPKKLGERWYPFFRWGWNQVDGSADPVSDTELQRSLQDEYYESRTQYANHRKDSMPVRLVRKSGNLTPDDVDKITHRRSRDIIPVEGLPGKPINDDIGELPGVTLNPAVYDTSAIRVDMELMAGRGDAAAGTVANAKTATEAEILREGLQTRSQERRDGIEDDLQEMAQYAAEILLQELTIEQVQRIAGEDAVWPQASKDEIFDLVEIDIRAGSTGMPNRAREREQWAQVMPLIKDTVVQISQAQQAGQPDVATALKKLLKETLTRYDERIDLEEFLPAQAGTPEAEQQDALMQAQQRVAELEQQLQQVMEQGQQMLQQAQQQAKQEAGVEAKQAEAQGKMVEAEYQAREKEAQRQADLMAKKAEADAKAAADREAKIEAARIAAEAQLTIARERMEFEREQAAMSKLLEIVTADREREAAGEVPAAEAVVKVGEGMQQQMDAVQTAIQAQNEVRDRRTAAVLEYLAGPRTPDRLQAAMQQIVTVH